MTAFRVVTINILNDLSHWGERRSLLGDGLKNLQPDLVAVQEANLPHNTVRWLADRAEMPHLFLTPKTGKHRTREGIAVLSRLPFEAQEAFDLGSQGRVAQRVQVSKGGQPFHLVNVHLFWSGGESAQRVAQVERLLAWLGDLPQRQPVTVCGDFNAEPHTQALARMRQSFRSAYSAVHGHEPEWTSPTPLPRSKVLMLRTLLEYIGEIRLKDLRRDYRGTLDYIFAGPHLQVLDCQLAFDQPDPDNPKIYPSDHLGLAATLQAD